MEENELQIGDYLRASRTGSIGIGEPVGLVRLSEKSGVHTSQIHRIEKNQNRPTIFSLVRICYGLELPPDRFFDDTKFAVDASIWFRSQSAPSQTQLQEKDVYGFIKKIDQAKKRLETLNNLNRNLNVYIQFSPPELTLDIIKKAYQQGAALSIVDFGTAVKKARTNIGYSLYDIDQYYQFDYESLSSIEEGRNSRLLFIDAVKLDQILDMQGFLIALGWHAAQFNEGLLKINDNQEITIIKDWKEMSKEGAQQLINSWRWIQVKQDEKSAADWLEALRKEIFSS